MACYTLNPAQGSTMLCTAIKSGTIKRYLAALESITVNPKQLDPLLDDCGQDAECMKNVLSEVKR